MVKEMTAEEKKRAEERFMLKADEIKIVYRPKCKKCGYEIAKCTCDKQNELRARALSSKK